MKVGESFSDSVRRRATPAFARHGRRLDVDVEQDLRVVADEADGDDEHARARRLRHGARIASERSGPIHGSGVRPALWNAT